MRYSMVLALALGNLVASQETPATPTALAVETPGSGTTPTTPSGTPTSTPGTGPGSADDLVYYGCLASTDGFDGFTTLDSSEDNSVDTCAKKAKGKGFRYIALHDTDCYGAKELNKETTSKVGDDECDISCPGAPDESCGGNAVKARLARRQNIPANFLLSVYISIANEESTATVTETVPGQLVTETATLTDANGAVVTVTNTIIAVPTDVVIICYGDYCAPKNHCPVCTNWQVVCRDGTCCPEECKGDDWDRLVICEGDKCHYSEGNCDQKVTCTGDKCILEKSHNEGEKKFSCNGDECKHESCKGDECGKKYVCEGDECEEEVQCKGEGCPTPSHNTPTPGQIVYVPEGGKTEGGKPMMPSEGGKTEGGKPMVPSGGVRPSKPWVPTGESCTGEGCVKGCTGEGCPVVKPCTGEGCPAETPATTPVVVSGAGQKAMAGLAVIMAGAVFAL